MNSEIQKKVRSLCRLEYLGAGFYAYLAGANKKNRELSKILKTFSDHEASHGAMFGQYYAENSAPGKSACRSLQAPLRIGVCPGGNHTFRPGH